jgi:hypothetical protein
MGKSPLVDFGAEDLTRIAQAFRERGLPVTGIYFIISTSDDELEDRIVRLVVDHMPLNMKRQMIYEVVNLRREGRLPDFAAGVRFDLVEPFDDEAGRVIDYTRRLGGPPAIIRDVLWKGLFIEYAIVAEVPQTELASLTGN